jgi:hypothetical protein
VFFLAGFAGNEKAKSSDSLRLFSSVVFDGYERAATLQPTLFLRLANTNTP